MLKEEREDWPFQQQGRDCPIVDARGCNINSYGPLSPGSRSTQSEGMFTCGRDAHGKSTSKLFEIDVILFAVSLTTVHFTILPLLPFAAVRPPSLPLALQ